MKVLRLLQVANCMSGTLFASLSAAGVLEVMTLPKKTHSKLPGFETPFPDTINVHFSFSDSLRVSANGHSIHAPRGYPYVPETK